MTNHKQEALSYADSGVDISAGNALVEAIKPAVRATKRRGVMGSIGGFGGLFDLKEAGYKDPVLVAATDGVGTKLILAQKAKRYNGVGIDLVAMCVNDLVVQGAEPLFFLDYYACGQLEHEEAVAVINSIAEGCKQAKCALIGGETAEMPGAYPEGEYDLAGFCVGAAERKQLYPQIDKINTGDVVIGLASSGVHSNGYSLVRAILKREGISMDQPAPFNRTQTVADVLLEPTKIYVSSCLEAIKTGHVPALAHITGGGLLENIPRVLPDDYGVELDLSAFPLPPLFQWLKGAGNVSQDEMLRTFNCGIGMVLIVKEGKEKAVLEGLKKAGEDAFVIGNVLRRGNSPAVHITGSWS